LAYSRAKKIKNMKHTLKATVIISALCFLLINPSYGQENFQPGYIINLNRDTIKGFIDNRMWDVNPKAVTFRATQTAENSNYSPIDIIAFGINGEVYESGIVNVDDGPYDIQDLNYQKELHYRTDTIFLYTLIQGDKSLYYYKEKFGKENFFIRRDSKIELLVFKRYLTDIHEGISTNTGVVTNNRYVRQLAFYFQNCPALQPEINKAEYRKESLSSLFLAYYDCSKSHIAFQKKMNKPRIELGAVGGMSLTKLKFIGPDDYAYLTTLNFPRSKNLAFGLYFNIILPRAQEKWSIYNEVLYSSFKVSGVYDESKTEARPYLKTSTLGFSYLKLNNMLRYKYKVRNVFVFINGGLSTGVAIAETNTSRTVSTLYTPNKFISEGKALNNTRKFEVGYTVGMGSQYRKLSLEIRYEYGNGFSNSAALDCSPTRIHFLLGYRISTF
jgi:hypothetical protein